MPKNILLSANNEISLGLAKLVLRENNIVFCYNNSGYEISNKDFLRIKKQICLITGLEWSNIT